ncbi:hypothetical protein TWF694_003244 [Orbilia ellipsospora]|uniref:NAD(P)-binding domain-containing protein n=1 Tax=Orbilia ellipsospora TaxID=2528407 RepID=A0AAV9X265_9PEZI
MKVIITGVTGFLGSEMLRQCIANSQITSVVTLARRDLAPEFQNEKKIIAIKKQDFGSYSDEELEKMKGAIGCLWTMGTTPGRARQMTYEQLKLTEQDWVVQSADAFSKLPEGRKFTFIYTSGFLVPDVESLDKPMWVAEDMRKLRGFTEKRLYDLEKEEKILAVVTKPAWITNGESFFGRLTWGTMNVAKEAMAAAYIDTVLNGRQKQTYLNKDLRTHGAEALKKFAENK